MIGLFEGVTRKLIVLKEKNKHNEELCNEVDSILKELSKGMLAVTEIIEGKMEVAVGGVHNEYHKN